MTNEDEQQDVSSSVSPLDAKIIKQIEYYFGDFNLPRDKFLREKVKLDEGWVPIETLLTFNRLKSLTEDESKVADAVRQSSLLEVSDDGKKVRRSPDKPLPESTTERQQKLDELTVYAKGFPVTATIDDLLEFFGQFGRCLNVFMRRLPSSRKFKVRCFLTLSKYKISTRNIKEHENEAPAVARVAHNAEERRETEGRLWRPGKRAKGAPTAVASLPRCVPLHALTDLALLASQASASSFTFRLPRFDHVVRDDYVHGIAWLVKVFDIDRSSDESDCYQEMLEAVHFDCDPLATSSSNGELWTYSPWSPASGNISQAHAGWEVNGPGARARIALEQGGRRGRGQDKNEAKRGAADKPAGDTPAKKAKTEEAAD
ncbi:unnamed protein product [Ixodes pacificus]